MAADLDRGLSVRVPKTQVGKGPWDAEAPATVADLVGVDQPDRRSRVLIAGVTERGVRAAAEARVSVPAEVKDRVTAEVKNLAQAGEALLAVGADRDEVDGKVLARAEVRERISVAGRNLASVAEESPARIEAPVLVAAEGRECVPVAGRDLTSEGAVDLVLVAVRKRSIVIRSALCFNQILFEIIKLLATNG